MMAGSAGALGIEAPHRRRSEEHTSELQSRPHLVCRLLLEKKNGFGGSVKESLRLAQAEIIETFAGAWRTALAVTLGRNGHSVVLAVRRRAHFFLKHTAPENTSPFPLTQLFPV